MSSITIGKKEGYAALVEATLAPHPDRLRAEPVDYGHGLRLIYDSGNLTVTAMLNAKEQHAITAAVLREFADAIEALPS